MQTASIPVNTANNIGTVNHPASLTHLDTRAAAARLGFAENTLRKWHCLGTGPIKPVRIGGRLRWSISEIDRVLAG